MTNVQPIPEGYTTVTPMLCVQNARQLLAFIQQAFDAQLVGCHDRPDGTIMHAEVQIGNAKVMLADATPPMQPMPTGLYLYVEDVDAVYNQAIAAGGTTFMEPADMFWGDRSACVTDASGNSWWISTHIEDLTDEEIQKRAQAFQGDCGNAPSPTES